MGLIKVTFASH